MDYYLSLTSLFKIVKKYQIKMPFFFKNLLSKL